MFNSDSLKNHSYGGRLKAKTTSQTKSPEKAKSERNAVVYKRLSTYEQVQNSRFSLERQHKLEQRAINDNYRPALSSEEIDEIRASPDYPGYYQNGQITVIEADFGKSGTSGQDKRPGLAYLVKLIESNQVESIYVVDVTRLFRDNTYIQAAPFAQLCEKFGIVIVTESMRLDIQVKMHRKFFLMQAEYAGEELEMIMNRLGGARAVKADMGLYAGGNIAAGFYVDSDPKSPTFERYLEYRPHAEVIRDIFEIALIENGSIVAIVRECRRQGLYFPRFKTEIESWMSSRTGLRFSKHKLDDDGNFIGYKIERGLIRSILSNPAYIGMPIRNGQLLEQDKENPQPVIVDPAVFTIVNNKLTNGKPKRRGKIKQSEPHLLQGILFSQCLNSDEETRPVRSWIPKVSSKKAKMAYPELKCSCTDDYPEGGNCFYVNGKVIMEPVRDYVLSKISYPEMAAEVHRIIEDDFVRSKEKAKTYKNERKRLQSEIDNILHNLSLFRHEGAAIKAVEQEIESRQAELRMLEIKEMQAYPDNQFKIDEDELEFITKFLSDMRGQWGNVPQAFQARLFQLIIDKIVIRIDGEDFFVDIHWKTGAVDTLWIERPLHCVPRRKQWTDEELELLREHYPKASVKKIISLFPDRTWDSIRTQANKQKVSRNIREELNWTREEDDMLRVFAEQEITYKQIRRTIRYRRLIDFERRLKKLGLEMPDDSKEINWCIVENSSDNGDCSPVQSAGFGPAP